MLIRTIDMTRGIAVAATLALAACGGGGDGPFPGDERESAQATAAPAQAYWSEPLELDLVPTAAANLPNGKVLLWSSQDRFGFNGLPGSTYTVVFDPLTGAVRDRLATETTHNMFCPGTTNLPDGRLLVNGGGDAGATSFYDATTDLWTAGPRMNVPRAYQGNTLLHDGSVLTLGGSWNGGWGYKHAEIWTEAGGWRRLVNVPVDSMVGPDPEGIYRADNHLWLIPTAHGRVLHAGPAADMHWIDTNGSGSIYPAGPRGNDPYSMNGNAVMFEAGKILKTGGAPAYEDADATPSAHLIDVTDGTAQVRSLQSMAYARAYHNSVVLPNGQVLVVGGMTRPVTFSDNRSILVPELWDPATETFTPLPPMRSPRNYHSVALLLPDARVLVAGGGLCSEGCAANHPDIEILTPHYLLNPNGGLADRPAITGAPTSAAYGTTITVDTSRAVTAFSMVRLSSVTHTVNNDQRRFSVPFTAVGESQYRLEIPSNPGLALPGLYMLFAIDAGGVPSVAHTLRIAGENTPRLTPPGEQRTMTTFTVDLPLAAVGSGTLSFAATELPPGLSIDTATGRITGIPTTPGVYQTLVSVSNDAGTVSSRIRWTIDAATANAARYLRFEVLREVQDRAWTTVAEFNVLDPSGNPILRNGWKVTADSEELVGQFAPAANVIDGLPTTFWHTEWRNASPPPPHWLQIDMGAGRAIGGFRMLPRQNINNGRVRDWRLHVSRDNVNWTVVAEGSFEDSIDEKTVFPIAFPAENIPPLISTPTAQSSLAGDAVSLQLLASDPEGGALSFAATGLPPGLDIDPASGLISGVITASGIYTVNLTVTDPRGASASGSFNWSVLSPTLSISPIAAPLSLAGETVSYVPAVEGGTNPQYRWDFGDGSAPTAWSSSPNVTYRYAAPGVYTVTLTATDASGTTRTRSFQQAVYGAVPAGPSATQSSAIGLQSPATGNPRLWVVNADADSVGLFDAVTLARLAEITVGSAPRTAAVAPSGRLWVTNKAAATISVVDLDSRSVSSTIALPRASAPHGIAFAPDGSAAFVALEASGRVLKLDPTSGAVLATREVGANPRHVSVTRDSARVLVSRFISPPLPGESTATVATTAAGVPQGGEVLVLGAASLAIERTVVLRHSERTDGANQGRGLPNYLGPVAIAPDGSSAWVPSKQDNVLRGALRDGQALDFQNTVRAISSRIDLTAWAEDHAARIDHDNASVASAAAFHPSGAYLFVALQTSRQIAVVDAAGKRELLRVDAGRAPDALVVSADGLRLFALNFMDRAVQVYDLTALVTRGESTLPTVARLAAQASEKLSTTVFRGKQFFYDARDPRLSRDSYMSCASCHNDGGHDGRTWDFTSLGEGLRNTISLRGRAGAQGARHWSGNFDETQDFEGQIRTLARGTGLMDDSLYFQGTRAQPLGDAKLGLSADLDALAAYVASLNRADPSPFRETSGALTSAAVAGRAVFARSCATCHGGAAFTDSGSGGGLRNVGTLLPSSGSRLGQALTGIDPPTLRDAWATAPYLHDGRAQTLAQAVQAHQGNTVAGTDLDNLVAFLAQIGPEEAAVEPTSAEGPPATAVACASERQTCVVPAGSTATVWFGAGSSWIARPGVTGSILCASWVFGDPLPGTAKSCRYLVTGVANTLPTVSLTAPAADTGFAAGTTSITVSASAADADGSILRVEFYDGSTLIGSDSTAPYSIAWANPATGPHTLTARAVDNAGGTTTSSPIAISVSTGGAPTAPPPEAVACATERQTCTLPAGATAAVWFGASNSWISRPGVTGSIVCASWIFGDPLPGAPKSCRYVLANALPTVAVTAPAADAGFAAGTTSITVSATAADSDGSIARVEFYAAATLIGTDSTAPYSIAWANPPTGSHALTARAFDNAGGSTTSSVVTINVSASGTPTGPPAEAVACASERQTCTLPAGATGTVWFGVGTSWVSRPGVTGSIVCASWVLGDPAPGSAKSCRYLVGGAATAAPTVSLTAPAADSGFAAGTTSITVSANAADSDGSITRVDFYDGTTLIGSDSTAPYSIAWANPAAGSHTLTARAFDNAGNATTSSAVMIIVSASGAPTAPPADAVACASERQTCTVPTGATATVWFGVGSTWVSRPGVTGNVVCATWIFGDPAPGTAKSCRYVVSTTTTTTARTASGIAGPEASAAQRLAGQATGRIGAMTPTRPASTGAA